MESEIEVLTRQRDESIAALSQLNKEKAAIEKELKSAQTLISKSKEARVIQNVFEEMAKLRAEFELLSDQKLQNDSLKDTIHSMVLKSDKQNQDSKSLIAHLRKQLADHNITVAEPETTTTTEAPAVNFEAKVHLLEAQISGMEKSNTEWKSEKVRLQKVIGNLKAEIEEYKIQIEERKAAELAAANNISSSKASLTSSWFKSSASNPSPAPAPAAANPPFQHPISPSVAKSTETLDEKPVTLPVPANVTQPSNLAPTAPTTTATSPGATSSVAAAARSWWGSRAASAAPTPAPTPAASNLLSTLATSTTSVHSNEEINPELIKKELAKLKALENENETLKGELASMKKATEVSLPALPSKPGDNLEKVQDLEKQNKQISDELQSKTNQINTLESRLSELNALREKISLKETAATKLEEENKLLISKLAALTETQLKYEELKTDNSKLNAAIALQQAQFDESKQKLSVEIDNYIKELESQKTAIASYKKALEDKQKEIEDLNTDKAAKTLQLNELNSEIKTLQVRLTALKSDSPEQNTGSPLDELDQEHKTQINSVKQHYESIISQKQQEVDSLKASFNEIEKKHNDLISQRDALFKDTKTSNFDDLKKIASSTDEHLSHIGSLTQEIEVRNLELSSAYQGLAQNEMLLKDFNETVKESLEQSKKIKELEGVIEGFEKQKNEYNNKIAALESQASNPANEAQLKESLTKINELNQQVATLSEEKTKFNSQSGEMNKKLSDLQSELDKKNAEISSNATKINSYKAEVESLQKQIARNKEASDFLSKSLQEQISQLLDSKASSDKKLRAEMEEKFKQDHIELSKKEKSEMEEKSRKAMIDTELRNTKEKVEMEEKFKKEKTKLTQDLEKQKKDQDTLKVELTKKFDTMVATKTEEINKNLAKIKSLETELVTVKQDQAKIVETLTLKNTELTKDYEKVKQDQSAASKAADDLKELTSKYELLVQENQVTLSGYQRNSKALAEKEEQYKKLKTQKDELQEAQEKTKKSLSKLEKDKELFTQENTTLKQQLESNQTMIEDLKAQVNGLNSKILEQSTVSSTELETLKQEKENLEKKLKETDHELTLANRKAAQMVKDLQKQLAKERRGEKSDSSDDKIKPVDNKQLEMLSQENEALIKRGQYLEEELRQMDEKVKRAHQEVEAKSKVVQMYILKEHEMALQPDDKPKKDMTVKMVKMEEELNQLKK
ncbi:hypothetical protein HDV06_004734 [Boothiomyces sp. JEL0866]|nr:hypothetical protein HDV06_004723 [Boothiomyces sp. JEL0866]KAJ3320956.1 hypothetical protein HDV06_004734 [Boothiomyces sp. JEL0866]